LKFAAYKKAITSRYKVVRNKMVAHANSTRAVVLGYKDTRNPLNEIALLLACERRLKQNPQGPQAI